MSNLYFAWLLDPDGLRRTRELVEAEAHARSMFAIGGVTNRQADRLIRVARRGHLYSIDAHYYILSRLKRAENLLAAGFSYYEALGVLWVTRAQRGA